MQDYTTKRLELFDEKFPPTQNEATHFEDCICWSCNYYRDDVKKFLSESIHQAEQVMMKKIEEWEPIQWDEQSLAEMKQDLKELLLNN